MIILYNGRCSTWLCSLSIISIWCFIRDSAADKPHPAADAYETLDTQRQGQEPQYDVVELDHIATRPQNAPHQSNTYENAAIATGAAAQ